MRGRNRESGATVGRLGFHLERGRTVMATMYCALCNRPVEAKRHLGVMTALATLATGGFWLLALPFYSKRCSICKSTAVSATIPNTSIRASNVPAKIADLERRLVATEGELEVANAELDHLRTERDFYQQLLADPARAKNRIQ
jgi:hypothetical protein